MYSHPQTGWVTICGLVGALLVINAVGSNLGPGAEGTDRRLWGRSYFCINHNSLTFS